MNIWTLEVLTTTFANLPPSGICVAAKVCKHWRAITLSHFPWTNAFTFTLLVLDHTELDDILSLHGDKPLHIEELRWPDDWGAPYQIKFEGYTTCIAIQPLNDIKAPIKTLENPSKLWRNSAKLKKKKTFGSNFAYHLRVTAIINLSELDNLREKGGMYPEDLVILGLNTSLGKTLENRGFWKRRTLGEVKPRCTFPVLTQPPGFNFGIKLQNYQLAAFSWMYHFERNPRIIDTEVVAWRSRNFLITFNTKTNSWVSLLNLSPEQKKEIYLEYNPRGGIFADETGLGKPKVVLALLLANPIPSFDLSSITKVEETTEILALRKQAAAYKEVFLDFLAFKPKQLITKERKNENNSVEYSQVDVEQLLYPTRASLLICTAQMVTQWIDEIAKSTNSRLKVIAFTTLVSLKTMLYQDIIDADVIVASYEFIRDPLYFHIGHITPTDTIRVNEELIRTNWVKRYLEELRREPHGGIYNCAPVLDHFKFQRIILDEGINALTDFHTTTLKAYSPIHGYWLMTGNPSFSALELSNILYLLNIPKHFLHKYKYEQAHSLALLLDHMIWRNTKDSIKK